jgi:tetratricopeptide (TPR) repeat protein
MPRAMKLSTLAMLGMTMCCATAAQAADCTNPRKAAGGMSEAAYRAVQNATDLLSKNKHAEAIEKLSKMTESGNDFEKAVVNYNLGFAYSSKNDYDNATAAFARALALNALPQSQHEQLQFNLGQLYIVAGKHKEGIETLQDYVENACAKITPEAHLFLANALSQQKRFPEALAQLDAALSKSGTPKESWLQLKLAIHYEMKDFQGCAQTLVRLISAAPDKPDYWKQLSSILVELKKETDAVAVLALAERQGFIGKPNELKNLYSIYMMLDMPLKAGTLMQTAVDRGTVPADESHLEAIANAWINAREVAKAEAVLKKLAAAATHGEYDYKLGAIYGDEERWKESAEALERAVQKGGLKRTGEAWLRLAVAHNGTKSVRNAIAALQKAQNYDETRKQASEWLRHLSNQVASNDTSAEGASS